MKALSHKAFFILGSDVWTQKGTFLTVKSPWSHFQRRACHACLSLSLGYWSLKFHVKIANLGKLQFVVFALLSFCPIALLPPCPCPCPRHGSLVHLCFGSYQEKTFFVFVFTFRFMCRYRRLSWCYSCLHRWQLWPSSLETNNVFALFGCNCWSSI